MAAYVLRNYRDVVFMNVAQLAAGVSPAAIVRFATVFGITDNELSLLVPLCPLCLLVVVGELSFTDFYTAPMALLNALVAEVARRSRTRALGRLTQLDDLAAARGYLLGGRRAAEV
jgi:DNA-binding MurR/RpiR family transcriptional regulator